MLITYPVQSLSNSERDVAFGKTRQCHVVQKRCKTRQTVGDFKYVEIAAENVEGKTVTFLSQKGSARMSATQHTSPVS